MLNYKTQKKLLSIVFFVTFLLAIDTLANQSQSFGNGLISIADSYKSWFDTSLIRDIVFTVTRVFIGFVIASILGILIGLFTGRYVPLLDGLVHILNYLRAITPVALAPFFLVMFGISELSKVLLVAWGAFFPVWINAHLANTALSEEMRASAKLQGLSKTRLFRHFYLPATLGGAYPGARIAIGISFILVYISETLGADYGVGYRLKVAYDTLQLDMMTASLLLLGALGLLSDRLFVYLATQMAPWLKYEKNADNR
ncbi:ABC transporter permease subunit [uncultured Draconibacterium sp.]|uniref:ABC transporter permease n=1 Tax=uncultured Draconibacterium sp. TaxID=1573823 RepID=UPI0029C892A9|nr:ABC transporter permease subunit [uncultured Draconibacterium sp.]